MLTVDSNLLEEIWRPVPSFEGKYWLSESGRLKNKEGRILKPSKSKTNPYLRYSLALGSKSKVWSIPTHRLVALVYIPNPNNYRVVHHKDHNKENNHYLNLEWTTQSQNIKEAIKAGHHNGGFKKGTKHHAGKYTVDQVQWIKKLSADGYSYSEIEKIFNTNRGYISQVINGKARTLELDKLGFQINCKPIQILQVVPNSIFN